MSRVVTFISGFVLALSVASAQLIPQSAHVSLYFPHLAFGGPPQSQWQTTLILTNTNLQDAGVLIVFYKDDGQPLTIDFGQGPDSEVFLLIPAGGSRVLESRPGAQLVTGWAQAAASLPIQATVQFGTIENGVPKLAVSSEATLPSYRHFYPANAFTSIALGNVLVNVSTSVVVNVFDSDGRQVLTDTVAIPSNGHTAFTLGDKYPSLGTNFNGSVELRSAFFRADFVAWAMRSNSSGVISSLPPGRYKTPNAHWDNIWMAFLTTLNQAQLAVPEVFLDGEPIQLVISADTEINAFAGNGGKTVQINLALAELTSDSMSELAFAVAHELGHIYQQRTGRLDLFPGNAEKDADVWGYILTLGAGYDPYASAGTLAKLAMVADNADLLSQNQQFLAGLAVADAHGSFNERVANVFDAVELGCSFDTVSCNLIKSVIHPHFPSSAPLLRVRTPERKRVGQ